MKIFIVEDDRDIRELESYALKGSGFDTKDFSCGSELFFALETDIPDMILLDIMLPGEDGLTLLKKLRANSRTADIPVMMATAKTTEIDKVKGLDMGADDYITKPFGIMEFVSRVKALLRRAAQNRGGHSLIMGDITLDTASRTLSINGARCALTYKEYELLKLLMVNRGTVLARDTITEKVWGFDYEGESRTVDMHIKTLRKKLGDSGEMIKTIRNVGYKITQEVR